MKFEIITWDYVKWTKETLVSTSGQITDINVMNPSPKSDSYKITPQWDSIPPTEGPQFDLKYICAIKSSLCEQDTELTPSYVWNTIVRLTLQAKQRRKDKWSYSYWLYLLIGGEVMTWTEIQASWCPLKSIKRNYFLEMPVRDKFKWSHKSLFLNRFSIICHRWHNVPKHSTMVMKLRESRKLQMLDDLESNWKT